LANSYGQFLVVRHSLGRLNRPARMRPLSVAIAGRRIPSRCDQRASQKLDFSIGFNAPSSRSLGTLSGGRALSAPRIQTNAPPEAVQVHRESMQFLYARLPSSQSTSRARRTARAGDLSPGAYRMPSCHAIPGISNRTLDLFPCRRPAMLVAVPVAGQLGFDFIPLAILVAMGCVVTVSIAGAVEVVV